MTDTTFKHTHYNFFRQVLGGGDDPLNIQLIAGMAPNSICGCSSCREALDIAVRDAKELIKTQCPASILQYGMYLQMIARTTIAAAMHEQNPTATPSDILRSAMSNFQDAAAQIDAFGLKSTEDLYNAGEEIAVAYLKRVL